MVATRRGQSLHVFADKGKARIYFAVNLYPFRETVASGADFAACVENVDIGGPAMIRAAAKNHPFVYVLVDAADYQPLLDHLANENRSDEEDARMRKTLAWMRRSRAERSTSVCRTSGSPPVMPAASRARHCS